MKQSAPKPKSCKSCFKSTVLGQSYSSVFYQNAIDQTAKWEYDVTKTTLTLGKKEDDQLSQWQYNKVFAYGDHFTSKDFYYQIAKGGQGEVKQKMTFKEIK